MCRFLLEEDLELDLYSRDEDKGWTPIQWARSNEHDDVVELLAHAEMFQAAKDGNEVKLMSLVNEGLDVNFHIGEMNALHISVIHGQLSTSKQLITLGATPDLISLALAVGFEHPTLVSMLRHEELLQWDLNDKKWPEVLINLATSGMLHAVKWFVEAGMTLSVSEHNTKQTILHVAAHEGYIDMIQYVLLQGVCIDVRDVEGRTALHHEAPMGHIDCLTVLLEFGDASLIDLSLRNIIHFAAMSGCPDTITMALESIKATTLGYDDVDNDGWTALHWAAREGTCEGVEELLAAGASTAPRELTHQWRPADVSGVYKKLFAYSALSREEDKSQFSTEDLYEEIFGDFIHPTCASCTLPCAIGDQYVCLSCKDTTLCFKCAGNRDLTHPNHGFEIVQGEPIPKRKEMSRRERIESFFRTNRMEFRREQGL